MSNFQKKLLLGLAILVLLSPLGIVLPTVFNAEDAWGEWSTETLEKVLGFVPKGLKKDSELWKAPIPDYNLGDEKSSFTIQASSYILSGIIGLIACIIIFYILSKLLVKKNE